MFLDEFPGDGTSFALRARWIFPVDGPPIAEGVVQIEAGHIKRLTSDDDPDAIDLGESAIVPGLVNAHTHLEFSELSSPLAPANGFAGWIRSLMEHRRRRTSELACVIEQGLTECTETGTCTLGEIATCDASADCLTKHSMRGVVFRELLALRHDDIDAQLSLARRHIRGEPGDPPDMIRGVSPHAPYTVHPELLSEVVKLLCHTQTPVAMHLAETREELELLHQRTGPLVELLKELGVWHEGLFPKGSTILDVLHRLAELPRILVIHGNYLTTSEIEYLADHPQFSVVFCPRTHDWFRHPAHPWRMLLDHGVPVSLGTDSRASNPDLSIWREIGHLRRQDRDVEGSTLLALGTIAGARALGVSDLTGSLTPGKIADLCVVDVSRSVAELPAADPHALLLHPATKVIASLRGGRWSGHAPVI